MTKSKIAALLNTLDGCVKKRNIGQTKSLDSPIDYLIIILNKKYCLNSTFTKKELLKFLPTELSTYKIEWNKNRIGKYIEQVTNNNNAGHTFKLSNQLPQKMINDSLLAVNQTWLKEFEEKLNSDDTDTIK